MLMIRQQCRARLNTRVTRQRMGRLTDTKVRGFMVTETNNDACAQLQPVLAHAASLTLQPSPPERLAPSCWAVGLFLSIAIKLNSGRMNLRSASKSTPDPPDACSKEWAHTPPLTRNARNIHKDIYRRCEWNTSVKTKPYTY